MSKSLRPSREFTNSESFDSHVTGDSWYTATDKRHLKTAISHDSGLLLFLRKKKAPHFATLRCGEGLELATLRCYGEIGLKLE